MPTGATDDVELARRAVGGDGPAFAELFDRWFDRAFDVAWHIVRNRDTAAEVAQETFATAWQQIGNLRQPESFGGWVLRIARNKGLNRLAVEQRARPVGDRDVLADHDLGRRVAGDPAEPVLDQERDDLVWAASAALGDGDASLLSLHLRHGLGAPELADELGIAANAAHQRLFRLKKRLGEAIGAWTLWHLGRPHCEALRVLLANAGTTRFGRDAAAMITAHTRGCTDCDDRRTLALSPEVLFGAVPLVAAGPVVKAEAAAALADAGVPATGAADATGATGATEPVGTEPVVEAGAPTTSAGGDLHPPGRGTPRRIAVLATAAVLAGIAVVALATRGDDAPDLVAAPSATTTTTTAAPPATPTAPSTTTPPEPPTVTATPATDPGAPAVTSPTTTPPAPPPEPEPEPEPDPPVVDSFRADPLSTGNCADPNQTLTTFTWSTTGATSAQIGPSRQAATAVAPEGAHTACAVTGSVWTLTVSGPGGTTTATVPVLAARSSR